ncbi:unnamed protein product [Paramecium pentaurelia]|uniref:Myb-like DNA-binding domain protein n=1 Tax=Paramecium pentaurelia TaxID=43138 RepID=A0A8S1WLG3_9CILI|nr:unnamed protein product [Paramecium pentaurelia]
MQRKNWKLEEDNALLQNCQQLNFNWKRVSKNMNLMGFKRSGKSCKERFQNQLNPHINKDQWSQNEIDKLFELQIKHGNKWRIIAKELPNRTDGLIKNYFYSLVRKVLRRLSKAVNRNKNGSKMTKTLKPSVISQIFCANQNETKQSPINLEFAYLFRNIIFKYKNYNLSQKIDNEDISKIKLIFLTLQKLNESYNTDNNKRLETKINQKQEKQNRKNFNVNFNAIIIDKINNKLPIFTTNLFPIEKLYQRQDNHFDTPLQINPQVISSLNSQNVDKTFSYTNFPLKQQQQQYIIYHPIPQYYYSMTFNAYVQQQQNLSNFYSSYQHESNKVKEEKEE